MNPIQPALQISNIHTGNDSFADFNLLGIASALQTCRFRWKKCIRLTGNLPFFVFPHKKQAKVLVPDQSSPNGLLRLSMIE